MGAITARKIVIVSSEKMHRDRHILLLSCQNIRLRLNVMFFKKIHEYVYALGIQTI